MPFVLIDTSVVPYIGTWIETQKAKKRIQNRNVVPYIGTWIETKANADAAGYVWVVPYIGTWIETREQEVAETTKCRTLYRYVD